MYLHIFTVGWVLFWAYWLVTAFSSKPTVHRDNVAWGIRLLVMLFILAIFLGGGSLNSASLGSAILADNFVSSVIALILFFLGLGLAVWARVHLGRNWGMPVSLKANPELVTTGPYRYIRNPIYSGVLLAMLATASVASNAWFIAFILFGIYFIYASHAEEKIMAQAFPDTYPAYRARTKMLIPGIL